MRGRKPVPTALKIARGNPGQRRIRDDEPQPAPLIDLAVPAFLGKDPHARAEWDQKAPMLHRLGLLTEADVDALTLYCATFARWKLAVLELRARGLTVKTKRGLVANPYLRIAEKAQEQCRVLLDGFGMSPVSRARVHTPKRTADDAQRDRFFGGPVPVTRPTA